MRRFTSSSRWRTGFSSKYIALVAKGRCQRGRNVIDISAPTACATRSRTLERRVRSPASQSHKNRRVCPHRGDRVQRTPALVATARAPPVDGILRRRLMQPLWQYRLRQFRRNRLAAHEPVREPPLGQFWKIALSGFQKRLRCCSTLTCNTSQGRRREASSIRAGSILYKPPP